MNEKTSSLPIWSVSGHHTPKNSYKPFTSSLSPLSSSSSSFLSNPNNHPLLLLLPPSPPTFHHQPISFPHQPKGIQEKTTQKKGKNPTHKKKKEMKKLYNSKGPKRVHPSPPPAPPATLPLLSFLPSALLALAADLPSSDQEVLAYLLAPSHLHHGHHPKRHRRARNANKPHAPELGCSCFGCYTSFWARWDASPRRHLIHAIIDAFEESSSAALDPVKAGGGRGHRKLSSGSSGGGQKKTLLPDVESLAAKEMEAAAAAAAPTADDGHDGDEDDDGYTDDDEEEEEEMGAEAEGKSSVRRFVSWVFGMNN